MSDTGLNVDYIVLAEFDIDRGSSITEQYPKDTGINPHVTVDHTKNQAIVVGTASTDSMLAALSKTGKKHSLKSSS